MGQDLHQDWTSPIDAAGVLPSPYPSSNTTHASLSPHFLLSSDASGYTPWFVNLFKKKFTTKQIEQKC